MLSPQKKCGHKDAPPYKVANKSKQFHRPYALETSTQLQLKSEKQETSTNKQERIKGKCKKANSKAPSSDITYPILEKACKEREMLNDRKKALINVQGNNESLEQLSNKQKGSD